MSTYVERYLFYIILNFAYNKIICHSFLYMMVCKLCGETHEGFDIFPPCIMTGDDEYPIKYPKCNEKFKNMKGFGNHKAY